MGNGCRNRRNARKRRNSTDVKRDKESMAPSGTNANIQNMTGGGHIECTMFQKCQGVEQRNSFANIETRLTSTTEIRTGKESSFDGDTSLEDVSKQSKLSYVQMVQKVVKKRTTTLQTIYPLKPYTKKQLVRIYKLTCRSVSFICLICRLDMQSGVTEEMNAEEFFTHEELTVSAHTEKDSSGGLPVCSVFKNDFVESHQKLFIPYWKNICKYVTDDKHIIDMHGLTSLIAKAATEFAVARESEYVKYVYGNADGSVKRLEIITGRGSHSKGHPVLPNIIVEHLKSFGITNVKKTDKNPGLLEVDIRNAKINLSSTDRLPLNVRSE